MHEYFITHILLDCSFVVKTIWKIKKIHNGHKYHDGLRGFIIARSLARNIFDNYFQIYVTFIISLLKYQSNSLKKTVFF